MGWRAPNSSNLAPGRAKALLVISAVKVDQVTTERAQILSGHSVGICPGRGRNNKMRGEGVETLVTAPSKAADVGVLLPLSSPGYETGEPPLVGVLALNSK